MGSDVSEVQETPLHASCIKVHLGMCTQLLRMVDRISSIFPEIEATRPRCSSAIQALCLLQNAIQKARMLVQNCCESSKLYLALTGETVVSRFERTRKLLQQSLSQLQNMVPVVLEFEISEIVAELRDTVFFMDLHEEEAGKALRGLLQQDTVNSVGSSEIEVLQYAALRLHLTSQKDLLIEKRSIRKLLDEVKDGNSTKRTALKYLLYLLKKYDKLIVQGLARNSTTQKDGSCLLVERNSKPATNISSNLESFSECEKKDARASILQNPIIPEELKCPLSSCLMHDPVIISSGQTFERSSIQRWFEEGHDTCPITKLKLANLSMIPNAAMRDVILKWSMEQGMYASDLKMESSESGSLETSLNSICSTASSMKDLHLQIDLSNISLGSLDNTYSLDFPHAKVNDSFCSVKEPSDVDSHTFQFFRSIHDIKRQFLSSVSELPWESQCRAVQDVKDYLIYYNPSCAFVSNENFLEPLTRFLKDALDKDDAEAQKAGTQLFLTFLRASRREAVHISGDVYELLVSYLGTEAIAETLAIIEVLSAQKSAFLDLAATNALASIVKFVNSSHDREVQEAAIRILYNLSSSPGFCSCVLASDLIPKLIPFLENSSVTGACLNILENLCKVEEARVSIAETDGCIASIIELLETGSSKDQERGVGILLSLCAQRDQYCQLVLHEGVVPALCHVSVNGSVKGKVSASELLRLLRDIKYEDEEDCLRSNGDAPDVHPKGIEEKKSVRLPGSFGRKMKKFWKKN